MFTKISLGDILLSPPENSIYGLMEISDKRQNNETDTTMENNNNLTQEDEREKLLRELSVKAENLRIKYSELSPAEEKELNDILGKIALLENQKNNCFFPCDLQPLTKIDDEATSAYNTSSGRACLHFATGHCHGNNQSEYP